MGAGFLIIHNALRREEEARKEEKRKEQLMRDKGYEKTFIKLNEGFSHTHIYRSNEKRKNGALIMVASLSLLSISFNLFMMFGKFMLISVGIFIISFLVGLIKFFNARHLYNEKPTPPVLDGFTYLRSENDSRYGDVWIDPKTQKRVYE